MLFSFCSRDYLEITNEKNHRFGLYCGQQTGKKVSVTGNYTLIKFHSNSNIQKRGFEIYFIDVPQGKYICPERGIVLYFTAVPQAKYRC